MQESSNVAEPWDTALDTCSGMEMASVASEEEDEGVAIFVQ